MATKIKLPPPRIVSKWNEEKVIRWLKKVNLEDCTSAFEARHIDGMKLLELTEQKLFMYQDMKIKHRSQIAKCVNECKSQASNAKRIVGTIRQRRNRERPSVVPNDDGEYDSDDDFDDWDSDFDEDFDDELAEETTASQEAISIPPNYIIENETNEAKENATRKQCETTECICPAPSLVPEVSDVPSQTVVNNTKISKADQRCAYPRPPLKRPPSQPPPPPVPQLPSQELLGDYEIPISHQRNSNFLSAKMALACELKQQTSSLNRNNSSKLAAFPTETYEFIQATDENYEIVESPSLPVPENPVLPPRATAMCMGSPPPPLPLKPKKLQDASAKLETLRSISRPKLPVVDDSASEGSGSLASVLGSTIMNSILGRRNSTPSSSPKIHHSAKDLSGNFSSADSQSSRSSSPDKDGFFTVGSSTFLSSASSTWSSDAKSPLHTSSKSKPAVPDEIAQNLASRPLPPVPASEPNLIISQQQDLRLYPWFHELERHEAENEIKNLGQSGGFLVRPSKRAGKENPYTLTILYDGKIFHLNIRQRPEGTFALGREKKKEKIFSSVAELIAYHQSEKILVTSRGESVGQTSLRSFPEK